MVKDTGKYKQIVVVTIILVILLPVSMYLYEEGRYNQIQSDYGSLKNNYDSLRTTHDSLQSEYDKKLGEYNSLSSNYNSLSSSYNHLQTDYNSLQSNYNSLQNNYNSLQSSFNSYKETVEVRYGDNSDCELFITPNDASVISKTSQVLGHSSDGELSYDDMKAINNWVGQNIKYNHDTFDGNREDCWLYPSETLSRGYGDCEDHALLMVSMCNAEADVPWIWCAIIKFQENGADKYHTCVFVNVENDQLYIFDPTSQPTYFFGYLWHDAWHSSSSKSEFYALEEYKNYRGASSMDVLEIFNEHEYHTFNSNQEFYNYF